MRTYLRDVGGRIQMHTNYVQQLQRVNDSYLMDIAISDGRFKAASIKRINYCWMYLNVTLLSQISPIPKALASMMPSIEETLTIPYPTALDIESTSINQTKRRGKSGGAFYTFSANATLDTHSRYPLEPGLFPLTSTHTNGSSTTQEKRIYSIATPASASPPITDSSMTLIRQKMMWWISSHRTPFPSRSETLPTPGYYRAKFPLKI